jgi:internalin A
LLALSDNQIQDIRPLSKLTSLTNLYISRNQIQDIEPLSKLSSLTNLYLDSNQIQDIEPLAKLTSLKKLVIDGNPCTENQNLTPYENHLDFLNLWLAKNKLKGKVNVLLPKKIVFLGNHASGKSSLLHFLREGKYAPETSSTHVLNVVQHNITKNEEEALKTIYQKEKIKDILPMMCYDFGGQDFYHGLYQSFSSKVAFQIVVYCANQTNISLAPDSKGYTTYSYPLSFWLQEKEYLERGNQNSYFIVENKIDAKEKAAFTKDYPILNDFTAPNGIFHVFLKAPENGDVAKKSQNKLQLQFLKSQLLQEIYSPTEISKAEIEFFKKVYKESVQQSLRIKKREEYKIEGISPENMLTQLQLLENSGVLFLSQDQTEVIANPKAFIQHIHEKILKKEELLQCSGKLTKEVWNKLNTGKHKKRVEAFMLKQKTMFIDKGLHKEAYIFPNYLPLYSEDEERYFLNVSKEHFAFAIQFQYFIPFGFINVLIHHFGKEPNKKKFWRDAIYFIQHEDGKPKANVFIAINIPKLTIEVSVEARDDSFNLARYKRYLWLCLSMMYHQRELVAWTIFNKDKELGIHTTDYELSESPENQYDPKILIETSGFPGTFKASFGKSHISFEDDNEFPETTKISVDGKYFVTLSKLKEHINDNKYNILLENEKSSAKLFPLHNFQLVTIKKIKKMKKIFISYSNQDIYYKQELEKFLKPFEKFQLAKSWSCEEMTPGLWDDQIQAELESSDIVIFMMSMNFASSDYILKNEVYETFTQMASNPDKEIICVLVKEFPWRLFAKYKDIFNIKENITEDDKAGFALANISNYQFLPYEHDTSKDKADQNRVLKAIREWEFEEKAFTQIVNTIAKIV